MTTVNDFDIRRIMDTIPHRYPFLLVDRIIDLEPGVSAVGIKNVTANEWFFEGHFPGNPNIAFADSDMTAGTLFAN